MQLDKTSSSAVESAPSVPTLPRILLVDDNDEVLKRAAGVLSHHFVIVGAVTTGRAALEAAATLRPDVIVLDISLPDLCGLEVAARLKAAQSPVAIVFLTVHDDEAIIRAARDAGGIGFVLKPRLRSELLSAVVSASSGLRFRSLTIPDNLW